MRMIRCLPLLVLALACAPSPSSTPSPSTSPASTATPAPPEPPKLSLEGFGPVRFGMALAEAEKALDTSLAARQPNPQCYFATAQGDPGVAFMIEAGRVTRADLHDTHRETDRGIHVGDTEERAKQVYGAQLEGTPHKYLATGHYLIVRSADRKSALVMETDGRTIIQIRAGAEPAAEYVEGCG